MTSNKALLAAALAYAVATPACEVPEASEEDRVVDSNEEAVLADWPYSHQVIFEEARDIMQRSVAALHLVNPRAGTNYATCGSTFIGPTLAVTAGHCVSHLKPVALSKQTINCNTDACALSVDWNARYADPVKILQYGAVSGTGPAFSTPLRAAALDGTNGLNNTYILPSVLLGGTSCVVRLNCYPAAGLNRTAGLCTSVLGTYQDADLDCAGVPCTHRQERLRLYHRSGNERFRRNEGQSLVVPRTRVEFVNHS